MCLASSFDASTVFVGAVPGFERNSVISVCLVAWRQAAQAWDPDGGKTMPQTTHDSEWFFDTYKNGDLGDGLLLVYPHY